MLHEQKVFQDNLKDNSDAHEYFLILFIAHFEQQFPHSMRGKSYEGFLKRICSLRYEYVTW